MYYRCKVEDCERERDLTGEDGPLAHAWGANEEDAGPRIQGSSSALLHVPTTRRTLYPNAALPRWA